MSTKPQAAAATRGQAAGEAMPAAMTSRVPGQTRNTGWAERTAERAGGRWMPAEQKNDG